MERAAVRQRIEKNPQLRALSADTKPGVPAPPKEGKTLVRKKNEPPSVTGVEMAQVVKDTEKLIHGGLLAAKVPAETLEMLRSLHGLGASTGEFLAQSVIDVQDLYSIELYKIPSRLAQIQKKYLDDDTLPGMERMFWQKAYTELLEQLGKGKDRMLAGAEVISAMLKGKKEGAGEKPVNGKAKPGW